MVAHLFCPHHVLSLIANGSNSVEVTVWPNLSFTRRNAIGPAKIAGTFALELAVDLLLGLGLLQRHNLGFGEDKPSCATLASSLSLVFARSWRNQTLRTPKGEIGKPCFFSSLEKCTWPQVGCSIPSATTAASIPGATRFLRIGFLRLISCSASSPPLSYSSLPVEAVATPAPPQEPWWANEPEGERERSPAIARPRCHQIVRLSRDFYKYGYRRVHVLHRLEGWHRGQNKTRRIYRELGLQLRNKTPKRRVKAKLRDDRRPATRSNETWAMDFVHD